MSETTTDSPFMNTKELAALLRKTPAAIRQLRYRGLAPRGFRSGKETLYRRTTVEAWLRAKEQDDHIGQRAAA